MEAPKSSDNRFRPSFHRDLHQLRVRAQHPKRVADAAAHRIAHQGQQASRASQSYSYGQIQAACSHSLYPLDHGFGLERELGGDREQWAFLARKLYFRLQRFV